MKPFLDIIRDLVKYFQAFLATLLNVEQIFLAIHLKLKQISTKEKKMIIVLRKITDENGS